MQLVKENENLSQKIGSPYYMAPEVLNKKYNQKCMVCWCYPIYTINRKSSVQWK